MFCMLLFILFQYLISCKDRTCKCNQNVNYTFTSYLIHQQLHLMNPAMFLGLIPLLNLSATPHLYESCNIYSRCRTSVGSKD